jgi:anhydro-N-acetylmuramic acid kinase
MDTEVKVIAHQSYDLDKGLVQKIQDSIQLKTNARDLTSLNFELAIAFSNAINAFIETLGLDRKNIDYIASHGQTIYHIPYASKDHVKSTLQLGSGSVIAQLTGITTVSNFRVADMAVGGQGAPLVPYAEYVLFSQKDKTIAMHNLGGISNLTLMPKGQDIDQVIAFDTGPANMMIDYAMKKLFQAPYDDHGYHASKGQLIQPLYDTLMAHPYLKLDYPKSTGRELFGDDYTASLLAQYAQASPDDIVHTLSMFTVSSIVDTYKKLLEKQPIDEIIFSGGGAFNPFLIENIRQGLYPIQVSTLEDHGLDSKCKEALAFVILGNETLNRHFNHIKRATGATRLVVLGDISPVIR